MKNKRKFVIVGAAAAFLLALLLTLYPVISNYINHKYASQIHTSYQNAVNQTDDSFLKEERMLAMEYNETLVSGTAGGSYSKEGLQAASVNYDSLLNVTGDGTIGYIDIPDINVLLPILHGTDAETLERGVGHLLGSSLPVGGENTHAVLSGHSGMAGKTMFTDLEQLEVGDVFYLQVLGEVLAYQIFDINVVLPTDIGLLRIVRDEDLCTLVTCTPYATNTHRLLVTGERIPYEEAKQIQEEEPMEAEPTSTWVKKYFTGLMIGLGIGVACATVGSITYRIAWQVKRNRKGGRYARKNHSAYRSVAGSSGTLAGSGNHTVSVYQQHCSGKKHGK